MTIYNILFPFLILVALGIAIYVLTRHLPEVVERQDLTEKKENKRWWQVLLGKGENLLRSLRVILLRLDNKLNESIKKVREKKEKMGENLKEYRGRRKQKTEQAQISQNELSPGPHEETIASPVKKIERAFEIQEDTPKARDSHTAKYPSPKEKAADLISKKKASFASAPEKKPFVSGKSKTVAEILKKTFTPAEIKVEKEQYWKKKEELLIKSVIREPKNVGLYLQLGRLYSNQRNWKDAKNAFFEAIKLDKTNVKAKEELKRIDKYLGGSNKD